MQDLDRFLDFRVVFLAVFLLTERLFPFPFFLAIGSSF